jgi:hypothetical protein
MTKHNWIFVMLVASTPYMVCLLFAIIKMLYGEWLLPVSVEQLLAAGVTPVCIALVYTQFINIE